MNKLRAAAFERALSNLEKYMNQNNVNGARAPIGSSLPLPLGTAEDMPSHWAAVDVDFDSAADRIIQAHKSDGDHRDLPITGLKTWVVAPHDGKFSLVPLARHHGPKVLRQNAFSNLAARVGAPADFLRKLPAPLQLANLNYLLAEGDNNAAATLRLRNNEIAAIVSDRYAPLDPVELVETVRDALVRFGILHDVRVRGVASGLIDNMRLVLPAEEHGIRPGEASGSITFRVADMLTVGGRPILDAFVMLLAAHRLYGVGPERTLRRILEDSRRWQARVSERLADQVLDAATILLDGLQEAAHQLTAEEKERERKYGSSWAAKYDYAYSGRLILEIETPWDSRVRKRWADGKHQRLEELLGEVIVGIEVAAEAWRIDRERRDRDEAERQRVRREAQRRERQAAYDRALEKDLLVEHLLVLPVAAAHDALGHAPSIDEAEPDGVRLRRGRERDALDARRERDLAAAVERIGDGRDVVGLLGEVQGEGAVLLDDLRPVLALVEEEGARIRERRSYVGSYPRRALASEDAPVAELHAQLVSAHVICGDEVSSKLLGRGRERRALVLAELDRAEADEPTGAHGIELGVGARRAAAVGGDGVEVDESLEHERCGLGVGEEARGRRDEPDRERPALRQSTRGGRVHPPRSYARSPGDSPCPPPSRVEAHAAS